jgi:CheY-like chemotaxis protein
MDVLVANEDDAVRELLRYVLELEGYAVTTAADGLMALEYLQTMPTLLVVLLDERMPGLTGTQVLEAYGTGAQTSPREFIVLTASTTTMPALPSSQVSLLEMPFATETLLAAVAQAAVRLESAQ